LAVSADNLPPEQRTTGTVGAAGGSDEDGTSPLARSIQEVTERAQLLVREEIELAKTELQTKGQKLAKGAAIGAAAGVFAAVALLFILIGFAWLAWYLIFPGTTYFWGFFLVAAILLIVAAIAGFVASRAFKAGTPPQPTMAIEEAKLIRDTVKSDNPQGTV
jgi:uncharacterized membrane protein YqjE